MSLANQVAIAVVEASRVINVSPTTLRRKARLVAAVALHRAGAVKTCADAARVLSPEGVSPIGPKDLRPSALKKIGIYESMIDPVIEALGGPKPPEMPKPGYQKVEGPKGFARIADPEERRALAAKGGAAVPAEKRAFAVNPTLASEAGTKGHSVRFSGPDHSTEPFRPKILRPVTIDVAAKRIAAARAEETVSFRRTEQDRRVPSRIVTAGLMGDPKPGQTPWAISPEDERQAMLERRLRQVHRSDRVAAIMKGEDRATEADRAKWAGLGQ